MSYPIQTEAMNFPATFYETIKKLQVFKDKSFKFNEKEHLYTYKGKKLLSVSSFINNISVPFKENQHILSAEKELRKEGKEITPELLEQRSKELLSKWDLKRDVASDGGHNLHLYIEETFKQKIITADTSKIQDAVVRFDNLVYPRISKMRFVDAEIRVFNVKMGIAGTIDTLFLKDDAGKLYIVDWKSNGNIYKKAYNNFLYSFSHIPNDKINAYSIQQSTYRILLEEAGIYVADCFLVYIPLDKVETGKDYDIIRCIDYRKEIREHFKHKLAA